MVVPLIPLIMYLFICGILLMLVGIYEQLRRIANALECGGGSKNQ